MEKPQSLADYLGTTPVVAEDVSAPRLEDIAGDGKAFAQAVLNSFEFRQYIVNGLRLGELPAAVIVRMMDLAGWQKPPERIEHTGKDGNPIETITEVRRVIVRSPVVDETDEPSYVTH